MPTDKALAEQQSQWFRDHPDYTRCKLCFSVCRVKRATDGLCQDCTAWQVTATPFPEGNEGAE